MSFANKVSRRVGHQLSIVEHAICEALDVELLDIEKRLSAKNLKGSVTGLVERDLQNLHKHYTGDHPE